MAYLGNRRNNKGNSSFDWMSLKGLFIFLGRKARDEGIPKAIQFSYWLKTQSIILARKSVEAGKTKAIEAGRILKGLFVFAARNPKTKGVRVTIEIAQLINDLSSLFYKKAKKVVENKVNAVGQDIVTERTKATTDATITPSSGIILNKEAVSLNERLAQ
jgi:hypothetical protein